MLLVVDLKATAFIYLPMALIIKHRQGMMPKKVLIHVQVGLLVMFGMVATISMGHNRGISKNSVQDLATPLVVSTEGKVAVI